MKQIICNCGRIAEVRHRSNGKKLAYSHCTNCGGSPVSAVKAAAIEAQAQEDIGIKGEFANSAPQDTDSAKGDFKPMAEDMPEVLEPEADILETDNDDKPRRRSNGFKWFVGITLALVCGGAYINSQAQQE